jgi:hypothetical protein
MEPPLDAARILCASPHEWPCRTSHAPQAKGYGAPELVTCGRDGCVRVWDVRQQEAPVAAFEPADAGNVR